MDADESMLSTPSSAEDDTLFDNDHDPEDESHLPDEDDESLFPGATPYDSHPHSNSGYIPAMTPANDHLNAAAPGELSPPRSQSLSRGNVPASWEGEDLVRDEGGPETDEGLARGGKSEKDSVGAWKSKKSQDEMRRAWEYVVDRDFGLKEYGDVLAGRLGQGQ